MVILIESPRITRFLLDRLMMITGGCPLYTRLHEMKWYTPHTLCVRSCYHSSSVFPDYYNDSYSSSKMTWAGVDPHENKSPPVHGG